VLGLVPPGSVDGPRWEPTFPSLRSPCRHRIRPTVRLPLERLPKSPPSSRAATSGSSWAPPQVPQPAHPSW